MPSLAGKVALVTGSSQGIGAALAMALAAEGAKVVVSDVQDCADTVRQIAEQGGEAIGVPADVTDNQSLKELVAIAETALGPVGVLVNNAGIFGTLQLKPMMQISEDEWDAVFRVNARGVFQATKAVIPSMQRAGGGSIINISSGTVLRGAPMFLHNGTAGRPILDSGCGGTADVLCDSIDIFAQILRRIDVMMHIDGAGRRACDVGFGNRRQEHCRGPNGSYSGKEGAPRVAGAAHSVAEALTAIAKAQPRCHGVLLSSNDRLCAG
jgi:NAD(P)-dependent dehydrogenase (short-subunit alcohol dehydrogenase family)